MIVESKKQGLTVIFKRIDGMEIKIAACADTGADETIIPRKVVNILRDYGITVPVEKCSEISFGLGNSNVVRRCTQTMTASLLLKLSTGELQLPTEKCYIVDDIGDEIMIGDPVLKKVGINVIKQLKQLACREEREFDELQDMDDFIIPEIQSKEEYGHDLYKDLLTLAVQNGLQDQEKDVMENVLHQNSEIFIQEELPRECSFVKPMEVRLKPNWEYIQSSQRHYSPLVSQFMEKQVAKLIEAGLIYANPTARWCSPCYPVKKPGINEWRMTIDYRRVNSQLAPMVGMMPYLASDVSCLNGMKCFATLDLHKGFWQLPLAPESQEVLSFRTDKGIYTPRRVPQGAAVDSALFFQQQMKIIFQDALGSYVLIWIDDIMVFAKTAQCLIKRLDFVFNILKNGD